MAKSAKIAKITKTTTKEYDDNTVITETKVIVEGQDTVVQPKVIKYDRLTKKKADERKVVRKIDTKRVDYDDNSYDITTKAYTFNEDLSRNLVVDTYEFSK